jgi:NAD(P)H-hydrate epimerase
MGAAWPPGGVPVTTAAESAALDAATIAAGTPSFALMERAARAAARRIVALAAATGRDRIGVHTGPGNNGGDGWLVAHGVRSAGLDVRVAVAAAPRTADAQRAQAIALEGGPFARPTGDETLVVDALLGTGQRGALRPPIAEAAAAITAARAHGALIVALDVPTGLVEGTPPDRLDVRVVPGAVIADVTLSLGSGKRALLRARAVAGAIEVLDLGLVDPPGDRPRLVDARWVTTVVPPIPAGAHKGTRGRLAIVGGRGGMVGAVVLAARGALASGIGLVRCCVDPAQVATVHAALPEALVVPWPADAGALARDVLDWADAVVVGPGLGRDPIARELVTALQRSAGRVLVDADALALLDQAAPRPGVLLLTPHPGEATRLLADGAPTPDAATVDARREEIAGLLAARWTAAVLLKGVPTVVAGPGGLAMVARGTAALATGGSGDVLSGIAGTLLAQGVGAAEAGAAAAWVHGVAAERATAQVGGVRGTTLAAVLAELPAAWPRGPEPLPAGVLATLPALPA